MVTRVQVLNSVETEPFSDGAKLCFQWCRYLYSNNDIEHYYRFIWKDKNGRLRAHRGQAGIPSMKVLEGLTKKAKELGWGQLQAQVL